MFLFKKRYNLARSGILKGMIDIHSHLMWGVDDGAKSLEQSRDIILILKSYGVERSYTTPHIMAHLLDNTTENLKKEFENSLQPLSKELDFEINLGAEYMLDEAFLQKLNCKSGVLSLFGNHLLVEMSHLARASMFDEKIYQICVKGYIPVLAHPERYGFLGDGELENLRDRGCKFQLNLLSLGQGYGTMVNKRALSILERGLYDFVGSDAHSEMMCKSISNIECSRTVISQVEKIVGNYHNSAL